MGPGSWVQPSTSRTSPYSLPWNSPRQPSPQPSSTSFHSLAPLLASMTFPPTSLGKLRTSDENSHKFPPKLLKFFLDHPPNFLPSCPSWKKCSSLPRGQVNPFPCLPPADWGPCFLSPLVACSAPQHCLKSSHPKINTAAASLVLHSPVLPSLVHQPPCSSLASSSLLVTQQNRLWSEYNPACTGECTQ